MDDAELDNPKKLKLDKVALRILRNGTLKSTYVSDMEYVRDGEIPASTWGEDLRAALVESPEWSFDEDGKVWRHERASP